MTLVLFVVAIGIGSSPKADELTENIVNCSVDVLPLNPRSLQRSVRIYGGIFIFLYLMAIIYQSLIIAIRFLNTSTINSNFRIFLIIDHIINNICMGVFIGTMVALYFLGRFWSTYISAVGEQNNSYVASATAALMYFTFVS